MAYSAPHRDAMRTAVYRDLRDVGTNKVFGTSEVNDFLDFGLAALNPVWPVEFRYEADETDLGTDKTSLAVDATEVWRVDMKSANDTYYHAVPPCDGTSTILDGWLLYDSAIHFEGGWGARMAALHDGTGVDLIVWGYRYRVNVTDDTTDFEFTSIDEEVAVREYARLCGLRRLLNDRGLFQQWQTQANNTDVSPNMLAQMLAQAEDSWRRWSNRNFRPRRRPVG